uniref:PGG domain-containing protein n=1 Tax=Aegilops tauschii subsp. strangulata TaxID=200361 RepID=A0A453RCZ5_AEGTS
LPPGHESSSSNNDDFELLWGHRKYLVLLGVLAVGVTYNAGLTPPGGSWTLNKDGHDAGDPVMHDGFSERYEVFFYCNATAFAASLVLIILLLSKSVTRKRMWLHSMQLTMILDLFSLLGAYAAGSCRALKSSIYIWVLVFAVITYVGIHTLVSTRFIPRKLKQNLQRMINTVLIKRGFLVRQVSIPLENVEEARKFILTLVIFAATITYQAGLNPPGGFWAENDHGSNKVHMAFPPYKHHPATSVLRSNYLGRYNIFIVSNSTSFVASLVIIILLLSPKLSGHGIRTKAVIVCVVVDLSCLIVAYAAGCCREVATSFYVVFIIVIVWISFAILAGFFVCRPVANWLQKVKTSSLCCVEKLGRALSLSFSRHRPSNAEQENSYEILFSDDHPIHSENVHTDSNQVPNQNADDIRTEKHLKKTRTCMLLLAILAVSLAYQSGLNPPGGFWSRSKDHHSAADRILEDTHHRRFIAFFYLNAIAFVASIVMITLLLNKMVSNKVTKRRALPITMIVVLLSLTGAFAVGNCREAKKTIFISALVCSVLAYVLIHVLIAVHIIPPEWRSN